MKHCYKCNETKTRSEFYGNRKSLDGLQGMCRVCCLLENQRYRDERKPELNRDRREKHRDSEWKDKRYFITIKHKYGLQPWEWLHAIETSGGCCQVCKQPNFKNGVPCIDHDHKTGEVRGYLCEGCNQAIGQMKDSPELLRKAAEYLETCNA